MCRRNQLLGIAAFAFGVGFLLGIWIDGGFLAHCFGIGVIIVGCCLLKKK